MELDTLLNETAKKPKKANTSPVVSVDEAIQHLGSEIMELILKIESLETERDQKKKDYVDNVKPYYTDECKRNFTKSIRVPCDNGMSLRIAFTQKASTVPFAVKDIIKDRAKDKYPVWFTEPITLTIKTDLERGQDFLNTLIKGVGAENFKKNVDVKRELKPSERYYQDYYTAMTPEDREFYDQYIVIQRPSVSAK